MSKYKTLQHTEWECQHHIIFIPKYRRKVLYGDLSKHLGEIFRRLARQKESEIEEGQLMPDHIHMMISIRPKYSVAQVMGYIKGKSAIQIARQFGGIRRNFPDTGSMSLVRTLIVRSRLTGGAENAA